eukprot:19614-Eustigmatos_ZCMA.PRE.1
MVTSAASLQTRLISITSNSVSLHATLAWLLGLAALSVHSVTGSPCSESHEVQTLGCVPPR